MNLYSGLLMAGACLAAGPAFAQTSPGTFNLGQIDQLTEKYGFTEFSLENLYINGLIGRTDKVKVLATGELKAKLTFKVNAISEKAKGAIEAAGGSVEIVK